MYTFLIAVHVITRMLLSVIYILLIWLNIILFQAIASIILLGNIRKTEACWCFISFWKKTVAWNVTICAIWYNLNNLEKREKHPRRSDT